MTHPGRPVTPAADLFWAKVNKTDTCWLWTASRKADGYGQFTLRVGFKLPRKTTSAHRWAYQHLVGPIPEGLQLDHLCRVRNCVNPDHLEAVTPQENSLRGETFAAANARKTACAKGHQYTPENTHVRRGGKRQCLTCQRIAGTKHRTKQREEKTPPQPGQPYSKFLLGRCRSGKHDITLPGAIVMHGESRRCKVCKQETEKAWRERRTAEEEAINGNH